MASSWQCLSGWGLCRLADVDAPVARQQKRPRDTIPIADAWPQGAVQLEGARACALVTPTVLEAASKDDKL